MSELELTGRAEDYDSEVRSAARFREQAGRLESLEGQHVDLSLTLTSSDLRTAHDMRSGSTRITPSGAVIISRTAACQLFVTSIDDRYITLATDVAGPVDVVVRVLA